MAEQNFEWEHKNKHKTANYLSAQLRGTACIILKLKMYAFTIRLIEPRLRFLI